MIKTFFFTLLFFIFSLNVNASPIISGISTNEISIDTSFQGAKILLFGAKGDAGDIIVSVRGPKKDFIVTRKQKLLGLWYNGTRVNFNNTYSFYSLFSTFNNNDFNSLLTELELGKSNINFTTEKPVKEAVKEEFKVELITDLEKKSLFSDGASKIDFLDETLFKIILNFPKNIVRGVYTAEIYLVNNGSLVSFQAIPIYVNQVGLGAKILDFAHEQSFLYGLIAVALALIIGWITNFIFTKIFTK